MNSNTEEVRPEEGTLNTTPKTETANDAKDPRADKPRKVLSWLKSCDSDKTLATLESHSMNELKEIQKILNKLQEKTQIALYKRAGKDLETARKKRSEAEATLADKDKEVAELEAFLKAGNPAEQQ